MNIVPVPATPGNHVPDHDTFAALSTLLALCLRVRRGNVEPEWAGVTNEVATWTLPDGHQIRRVRHKDLTTYKQTITASHPAEHMIARLIIDACTIVQGQEPDIAQCIEDLIIARTALENVSRRNDDPFVETIDAASIELVRSIIDADGLVPDRSFTVEHRPTTPWRKGRVLMHGVEEGRRSIGAMPDFPMVVVLAVDEPYGIARRISVRMFPYDMDHDLTATVDPMTRLRGAEALNALRKGSTS